MAGRRILKGGLMLTAFSTSGLFLLNLRQEEANTEIFFINSKEEVEDVLSTLLGRKKEFEPYCSQLDESKRKRFKIDFLVSWNLSKSNIRNKYGEDSQLVWCPIFKSGATNWYERFAELGGATKEQVHAPGRQIQKMAMELTGSKPSKHAGLILSKNSTVSFVVVRNPFTRLVSAFRDKMECSKGKEFYYQKYGKSIVNMYRQKAVRKFGSNYLSNMEKLHQSCRKGLEPTFWEFVQFVIRNPTRDEHWTPSTSLCNPCAFNFTYVVKFERLAEEEPVMLKDLGLDQMFPPIWKNKHKGKPTSNYLLKYLKMLEEEDWKKLMEVYYLDIDLFMYRREVEKLYHKVFKQSKSHEEFIKS